jgi:tetratricopeptide (TPR) repeat protein
MNAGFLYVLINASMPDVVKVGMTERDPESRARELSGVTGVPTPFVVVYQEFFDDCSAAEEYVHALLEGSGYRVATNREFFSAPTRVAIQALIQAKGALGGNGNGEQPSAAAALSGLRSDPQSELWEGILDQADDVRYGLGDALQDLNEAARLYQQAARLGSAKACLELAELYLDDDFPDANEEVAITWLKEGGRRGDAICFSRLARVYLKRGHAENAGKCWKRFREGSEGHEDAEFWGECFRYLLATADTKTNIADFDWFDQRRDQIIRWGEELVQELRNRGARSDWQEADLCLVRYLVDPEAPVVRSRGFVESWNATESVGLVRTASGKVAFLLARWIVEGKLPPIEGQPADFVLVESEKGDLACVVRLLPELQHHEAARGLFKVKASQARVRRMCLGLSVAASDLSEDEAREVAARIGLSSEQLSEAQTYPLSEADWQSIAMMPASFFPRAWKQMEENGNAAEMMKIAAVLARIIDRESLPEGSNHP